MVRTAAVLPVKRFSHAKQRLGASVADHLRADLVRAMVGDVLSALSDCHSVGLTIVVTNEESVAAAARHVGAIVVEDSAEAGQSAAVALGLARALIEGAQRALCIPGDCPALDPAEVNALLGATDRPAPPERAPARGAAEAVSVPGRHGTKTEAVSVLNRHGTEAEVVSVPDRHGTEAEVVIVPDRHGTGTNGLVLSPPDAIAPSFGPGSCERHLQLAHAAGVACRLERPGSLLLDIDTGADLQALRERLRDEHTRAPRTRAVLSLAAAGPAAERQPALTAR